MTERGILQIARNCHQMEFLWNDEVLLSDEVMSQVANFCPGLKSISFRSATGITDEGVIQLAKSCTRLEELDLYSNTSITDRSVLPLAENCPELQALCLHKCRNLTDEALSHLGRYCHKLKSLYFKSPNISDDGIKRLAEGCPCIEYLTMASQKLTDEALIHLGRHCHNLSTITIKGNTNMTDAGVLQISQECPLRWGLYVHNPNVDATKLFLVNLPNYLTESNLNNLFSTQEARVLGISFENRGFGYVKFGTVEELRAAQQEAGLKCSDLDGRTVATQYPKWKFESTSECHERRMRELTVVCATHPRCGSIVHCRLPLHTLQMIVYYLRPAIVHKYTLTRFYNP